MMLKRIEQNRSHLFSPLRLTLDKLDFVNCVTHFMCVCSWNKWRTLASISSKSSWRKRYLDPQESFILRAIALSNIEARRQKLARRRVGKCAAKIRYILQRKQQWALQVGYKQNRSQLAKNFCLLCVCSIDFKCDLIDWNLLVLLACKEQRQRQQHKMMKRKIQVSAVLII